MKSIFKILVLGAVPILAVTMVADQGLRRRQGFAVDLPGQHRSIRASSPLPNANSDRGSDGAGSVLQRRQ